MKKVITNIRTYLKNNWLFVLIMIIGSGIIIAQMSQVVLYADDYTLGYYNTEGIKGAFEYFTNHYQTWGGGYTSFFVILFTMWSNIWWQLFLSALIIIFVGLSVKMICKNHQKNKWLVAAIMWSLIFILSIYASRETIYWLDGGMAYLFSMFQVFIYFYFVYTRLVQGVHKKYDLVLIPFLGFFAGWSSAQSGLIAILTPIILILWQRLVKKQKVAKLYYISTILTIIGFLIFYFAPGNSARMNEFELYTSLSFFGKIAYRTDSTFSMILDSGQAGYTAAPLFVFLAIGLTAIVDLHFIKNNKTKKFKKLRLFCSIYNLLFIFMYLLCSLDIPALRPLVDLFNYSNLLSVFSGEFGSLGYLAIFTYLFSALAILCNLVSAFTICKHKSNPLLITLLIISYVAEFCMVMAPYSPIRTTFYTIAFMWVCIGYLISLAKTEKISIFPVILPIFAALNIYLGIAILICYIILRFIIPIDETKKDFSFSTAEIMLFTCILSLLALVNAYQVFVGYHTNKIINDENISRIQKRKEYLEANPTDNPDVLYLVRPANDRYTFTGLAGVDWVEESVNLYFGMPKNQNIEYEGED